MVKLVCHHLLEVNIMDTVGLSFIIIFLLSIAYETYPEDKKASTGAYFLPVLCVLFSGFIFGKIQKWW